MTERWESCSCLPGGCSEAIPVAGDPQDKACVTYFCRTSQGSTDTREKCNRTSCCSPSSYTEDSRVVTPGLPCLNILRKLGTKKGSLGRRENFRRSRWKDRKHSYNKALTTATACFSHSLIHLTKEPTPQFAKLLSSSEDSWTSWKNARQCKSFKSCGYTTWKLQHRFKIF